MPYATLLIFKKISLEDENSILHIKFSVHVAQL